MRVLILSSLRGQTGNNATSQRIRQELLETDIKCELAEINQFDKPLSLNEYIDEHDIDCILGLHVYRAGSLLIDSKVPFCIIFGGTDINEYHNDDSHMMLMTKAVTQARFLVAFSDAMKTQAIHLWPECRDKIVVQPQAFITGTEDDEKQIVKCQNKLSGFLELDIEALENTIIFLLIAGLRQVKDPLYLTEIVSKWHQEDNGIHLIIIGPELDDEFTAQVKRTVKSLPGITLMCPVNNQDLQTIMKLSFAVVNSSISEGMATSLVEAMALGVPVLARNIPGNAAIISHCVTGFLFNTPQQFKSIAKELVECKHKVSNILQNAQTYVYKNHSFQKEKMTYVSIIEKMAEMK